MILALLKKFAEHSCQEETERYNALLNAYDEIKNVLTRKERQTIIESLLEDENETAKLIYELPLKYNCKVLSGCRLFFPREQGLYKFWDAQDKPGLWCCFGAFQLHLTTNQVISKISILTEIEKKEILDILQNLKKGISYQDYNKFPDNLRKILQNHVMVAIPGKKSAWLNPRIPIEDVSCENNPFEVDQLEASALAIENIWDESEYLLDVIAKAPNLTDFQTAFSKNNLPFIIWKEGFDCEEAYKDIEERYINRLALDNGHIG